MEKKQISKKLESDTHMQLLIGLLLCAAMVFVCWATVAGGSANDPTRYEEDELYGKSDTEKKSLSSKDEDV